MIGPWLSLFYSSWYGRTLRPQWHRRFKRKPNESKTAYCVHWFPQLSQRKNSFGRLPIMLFPSCDADVSSR